MTSRNRGTPDAWQATRAQTALATQFLTDKDDYLAEEKREVGRRTNAAEHELFVSCAPAEALEQQFKHLRPEFIAIHDIGTAASKRLLAGIGATLGRSLQHLSIRRQGYGTTLARLDFIELPTGDGGVLRMYSTAIDTGNTAAAGLARTLLGFSRLGVVMIGDLAPHAIAPALKPLHDHMLAGPWHNRNLLLLPLAAASLATHGIELTRGTSIDVRTTPQVSRPTDAWDFISGTWARLRELGSAAGAAVPALVDFYATPVDRPAGVVATAATAPLPMRPMPEIPKVPAAPVGAVSDVLDRYVRQLAELTGMLSCCVVDIASRQPLTHAGKHHSAGQLALHGAGLLESISNSTQALGLGREVPGAALTLHAHYLLLRAIPRHPGLALHCVLDKAGVNLTLVQLQVLRMDALFDNPVPN